MSHQEVKINWMRIKGDHGEIKRMPLHQCQNLNLNHKLDDALLHGATDSELESIVVNHQDRFSPRSPEFARLKVRNHKKWVVEKVGGRITAEFKRGEERVWKWVDVIVS